MIPIARSVHEIYKSADADAILCLLSHKVLITSIFHFVFLFCCQIIRTCLDEGIREGRVQLQDWLTILLSKSNEHQKSPDYQHSLALDLTFSSYQTMRPIPRLVFGMLKSPLLRCSQDLTTVNITTDEWIYHQFMYGYVQNLV